MEDFDLTTEEGRRQHAIASIELPNPKNYDMWAVIHIKYIDEPPMRSFRLSHEGRNPPTLLKVAELSYVLTPQGWRLIDPTS